MKIIADKVGIKDSSLYKHFSSKKEIFDTIVQEMSVRMEEMSRAFGLPDEGNLLEAAGLYGTVGIDKLLDLSKQIYFISRMSSHPAFAGCWRSSSTGTGIFMKCTAVYS